jgi:hypothetical protein
MNTFNKIKSFVNLTTYEEQQFRESYSVSSNDTEDQLDNVDEILFGTDLDKDKFRDENILLSMLEDIQKKTNDIVSKGECSGDIKNLEENFLELKNKIEDENKKDKKQFKKLKYILTGLHAVCITLGIVTFIYYRKSSAENIIKELETKSFRATKLSNDSWLFKSQPKISNKF